MAASSSKRREPRAAVDDRAEGTSRRSRLDIVSSAILSPFTLRKPDSSKLLSDLAPVIMTPKMINGVAYASSKRDSIASATGSISRMDFAILGRAPLRLTMGGRRVTSRDLQIVEATDELLEEEVPEPDGVAQNVSLLRGFNATIPSADKSRTRRRQTRNVEAPRLGLKRLGMNARGMLGDDDDHESVASEDDVVLVGGTTGKKTKGKRRGRQSLSASVVFGRDELVRQTAEIERDKENIHVRRALINSEISEITHKIEALDAIRTKLEQDLLRLQEDELELDDELEGVKDRLELEESRTRSTKGSQQASHVPHTTHSSRRRKGPAFLPSEHDELPHGVAFMSLEGHTSPITALDFSEPYGTLVSASQDDSQPRVWDLLTGEELGRLRGHKGTVKCVQVEDMICLTGGDDGNVRVWDLRKVDEDEDWERTSEVTSLSDVAEEDEGVDELGMRKDGNGVIRQGTSTAGSAVDKDGPCVRLLEGHTKAVTALYFEEDCLVTGASDKTMRQWDLTTGQCVMTMDILWAISHPPAALPGAAIPNHLFPGAAAAAGTFAVPSPPYSDGTWEMYQDFVGAVQFWEYALVSGSGDGAVRMWDMRTGQPHRTLLGHTAPVTSLQFDELHVVTGSLDKSIRIWDLRMGSMFETLKYDYPVTGLQFDTRKIVAATGENGIELYNRTSMQHSRLLTNGHTQPTERLRYMDKYLVSGGRDTMVKIWAL